jgi:hypothetical protein
LDAADGVPDVDNCVIRDDDVRDVCTGSEDAVVAKAFRGGWDDVEATAVAGARMIFDIIRF